MKRFPSLNRYTTSSQPKNRFLIDSSRDKFWITGFSKPISRISFGCSRVNIRIPGFIKPESRMYSGAHWMQTGHPVIQFGKLDLISFLSASKPDSWFFKSEKLITVCMVLPHNRLTGSLNRKAEFVKPCSDSKLASRLFEPVSRIRVWTILEAIRQTG